MDIDRLLRVSGMDPKLEDKQKLQSLSQDLENIVDLIAQLPDVDESQTLNLHERFMSLAGDEFGKIATTEEVLSNTEFKANNSFKIG